MARQNTGVSRDEVIRRAREELGDETIAKIQSLPADIQQALLVPRSSRNKGGRPKGTGMDLMPALMRMAELQEDEPDLDDRPAAKRVAMEMRDSGQLNVTPETLRKAYRARKADLLATVRNRKMAPRFKVAASHPASPRRRLIGPVTIDSIADAYKNAMGPTTEELMRTARGLFADQVDEAEKVRRAAVDRFNADLGQVDMAYRRLDTLGVESLALKFLRQEEITRKELEQKLDSASREAFAGVEFLLGKKPGK